MHSQFNISDQIRVFDLLIARLWVGRCAVYPSVSVAQGEGGGGDNTSRARYTLSVDLRCAKWATEDRRRVIFTIHRLTAHRNFGS